MQECDPGSSLSASRAGRLPGSAPTWCSTTWPACRPFTPARARSSSSSAARRIRKTMGKALIRRIFEIKAGAWGQDQARLYRGVRHARCAPADRGRGSMAEHAAAAAGGVGHQRHEGGDQRRAVSCRSSTAGGSRAASKASPAGRSAPTQGVGEPTTTAMRDAESLYGKLEHVILPMFYCRPRSLYRHHAACDCDQRLILQHRADARPVRPQGVFRVAGAAKSPSMPGDAAWQELRCTPSAILTKC